MKKEGRKDFRFAIGMLVGFLLWTAAVRCVDVQPIGPEGSTVGFATVNGFVHTLTGVHMTLYTVTDLLSLVPFGFVLGFGLLGLCCLNRCGADEHRGRCNRCFGLFGDIVYVLFRLNG